MRAIGAVVALALCALLPAASATYGLDCSSGGCDSGCFGCLHSAAYNFAIVRGYESVGAVDPNVVSSVAAAWAGGMAHVDVYMFPCPTCGNPQGQVADCVNNLVQNDVTFGMLWLDIEGSQYWMDQGSNQQFFSGLVAQAQDMGVHLGVYTSYSQWNPIMGAWDGGSGLPIWYANYDGAPNFNDWFAFAGWNTPAIKQYNGDVGACGFDIDQNWYPDGSRTSWPAMWPSAFNVTKPAAGIVFNATYAGSL